MRMINNNHKLPNNKIMKTFNKCTPIFLIKKLRIIILISNGISVKAKINKKFNLIHHNYIKQNLKRTKIHKHLILIKYNLLEM
jgi:hypothetical protein